MLQAVDVGIRRLRDYEGVAPVETLDALRRVAAELTGLRVLHLNATPYGGGVSELLRSAVPLLDDLGIVADWKTISGDTAFFDVTKTMHNGLQGAAVRLSAEQQELYRTNAKRNSELLDEHYDVIVVHDPQPAGIRQEEGAGDAIWVWRCHIDTSAPDRQVWAFLRPFLADYDAAVFTLEDFVPPDLPVTNVMAIPPAIDPLSPKNLPLADGMARRVLEWIGLRLDVPLVTQVSRFDPWKDPLGVIEAYRLAREEIPDLQLVLAGSMALDDPEGWQVYEAIRRASERDPLIHVFTNLTGVGNIEVNALQRFSDVVVQKSLREGFGLVVSEALWKRTPVVAGRAGGIPLQMADGVGGYLVDDVAGCAAAVLDLLQNPSWASELAEQGRERVRKHFLLPRLLLNELTLLHDLTRLRPPQEPPAVPIDPVCGIAIQAPPPHPYQVALDGQTYVFCSDTCRRRFRDQPWRWDPTLRRRRP